MSGYRSFVKNVKVLVHVYGASDSSQLGRRGLHKSKQVQHAPIVPVLHVQNDRSATPTASSGQGEPDIVLEEGEWFHVTRRKQKQTIKPSGHQVAVGTKVVTVLESDSNVDSLDGAGITPNPIGGE